MSDHECLLSSHNHDVIVKRFHVVFLYVKILHMRVCMGRSVRRTESFLAVQCNYELI